MAVVIITEPEGVTLDIYDAVDEKLQMEGGPPEGLQVHIAGMDDSGQFRVIDVWDSREQHDRFRDERLIPAIREVAQERGFPEPSGPPNNNVYEAHDLMIAPGVAAS